MKKDVSQKYPLVYVVWKDAQSDCMWKGMDDIKEWASSDCLIHEIGWLVYENKRYIILSSQVEREGDIGNRTKIPKDWVFKKQKIRFTPCNFHTKSTQK